MKRMSGSDKMLVVSDMIEVGLGFAKMRGAPTTAPGTALHLRLLVTIAEVIATLAIKSAEELIAGLGDSDVHDALDGIAHLRRVAEALAPLADAVRDFGSWSCFGEDDILSTGNRIAREAVAEAIVALMRDQKERKERIKREASGAGK